MGEKLNMSQLEEMIGNAVKDSVKLLADEHKVSMDEIKDEVDEKIKEIVDQIGVGGESIEQKRARVLVDTEETDVSGLPNLAKDPTGGFYTLSQFAHDVYKTTKSGYRTISPELKAWEEVTKAADATTLSTDDAEYGGFLIPPEFKNELWLAVEQKNEILPRCTNVPMRVNTIKIPYVNGFDESGGLVYGGIEWKWLDELAAKTASRPKIGRITLSLKKIAGLAYSSDELLEDSPISMENILKNGFRDGLNFQITRALIRGTGAGQPLGVLNAPCYHGITIETGQAASTIVFENIIKMYAAINDSGNAIWLANENTLPQLATMALDVGTGGVPVFMPANGAAGIPYNTLMGRPLVFNKHCSTLGTAGDILLVDWSQYLVGMKAGQGATGKFDTSIHLKFADDQTAFRFVFRIDGQPWWPTYLTPPQATTDYISPVVGLDARA